MASHAHRTQSAKTLNPKHLSTVQVCVCVYIYIYREREGGITQFVKLRAKKGLHPGQPQRALRGALPER